MKPAPYNKCTGQAAYSLRLTALIILFSISSIGWIWGGIAQKNKDAIRMYNDGEINEALSKWRDAQIDNPEQTELHYNIGSALYKQKEYEDAFREFEKSFNTKNAELQGKTYYNIGNIHFRMGKLPEAIESYKRALDIDPDDEDAKYNIEFVRKIIKENLEKQESQQEENQKEQNQDTESQQQQKKGSEKEEKEGKEQEEQEGEEKEEAKVQKESEEEEDQSEEGEESQRKDESAMSEEDALRILDALRDDEKDLQKDLRTQQDEGRYRVDKDW